MKSERLHLCRVLAQARKHYCTGACHAKSDLYKNKFFHPNSNQRFVEPIKHLLGWPPHDEAELAIIIELASITGHDAGDRFPHDSIEYEQKFGINTCTLLRIIRIGARTAGFSHVPPLSGYASSDRGSVGGSTPDSRVNLVKQASTPLSPLR